MNMIVNNTTRNLADRSQFRFGLAVAFALFFISAFASVQAAAPVDFDGDGVSDFAVVRNTGGGPNGTITWFIALSDFTGYGTIPYIRSVDDNAGLLKIIFDSKNGTNNAFQSATSLMPGTWQTRSNFFGNGGRLTNTMPTPTNQFLYFRIVIP